MRGMGKRERDGGGSQRVAREREREREAGNATGRGGEIERERARKGERGKEGGRTWKERVGKRSWQLHRKQTSSPRPTLSHWPSCLCSEVASPKDWEAELGRPGRSRRMLERWVLVQATAYNLWVRNCRCSASVP